MRLFSKVQMKSDYSCMLRARNYRLAKMLQMEVLALVLRCSPERHVSLGREQMMHSEIVRAVMHLAALMKG